EIGVRGKARTGSVGHEWVLAASHFRSLEKNAYAMAFFSREPNNLINPVFSPLPAVSGTESRGGDPDAPSRTNRIALTSYAVGDTLSLAGDTVLLTLGARHQQMRITAYDNNTGAEVSDYDKSRTSPMASVVWKATPALSLYANYIEGL